LGHRLRELAALLGGRVLGDDERTVDGVRTLDYAGPEHLSFLTHAKYLAAARRSRAGVLLVGPGHEELGQEGRELLVCENPAGALARLLEQLFPARVFAPGIHRTAVIAGDCRIHPSAHVGAYVVIEKGCTIEAESVVQPFVYLGRGCRLGERVILHPHVVVYDGTEVGRGTVVHSGVVLGADGFGYAGGETAWRKVPQVGRVVVEADVEIGANSAIDRAMLDETRIGAGSKIDNLVQIGHNVHLGSGCILCGQAGVAGSAVLGERVVLGGKAGVAGHLRIGDGVRVGGQAAVFSSLPAGVTVAGTPATGIAQWKRQVTLIARLEDMRRRLRELERQVGSLVQERKDGGE
jgi:UDP-3-O-[3-hydroxymyristoyl] glucosamine N-acyltransferase